MRDAMSMFGRARMTAPAAASGVAVHAWQVDLDGIPYTSARQLLSADECARADSFRFDVHRVRFVAGRAALRVLLGRELQIAARDVVFVTGRFGKPALAPSLGTSLRFNLSHSENRALIATAWGADLGVDLEYLDAATDMEELAVTVFSTGERAELAALPEPLRVAGFFSAWTRKEAYLKARGEGLSRSLQDFDVRVDPRLAPALLDARHAPGDVLRWSWSAPATPPAFAAAICVEGVAHTLVSHPAVDARSGHELFAG
nr:phosphopantetheine-protein transferase [uncultured bacterium]